MTQWLLSDDNLPQGFDVEDECEFRSSGEFTSVIRCKHVDMGSQEIRAHVQTGKRAHRLAMNWHEKLSFVLHDDLSVRRIRYSDELVEQADAGGDERAQFDADFSMMGAEVSAFIPALLSALNSMDEA